MSDKENHNDPIESFFRNKADDHNIPFREDDWLDLERKLDIRAAQLVYRRRLTWVAAAAFLLISMFSYFTWDNYNRINELSRQLSEERSTAMGPLPELLMPSQIQDAPTTTDEGLAEDTESIVEPTDDVDTHSSRQEVNEPDRNEIRREFTAAQGVGRELFVREIPIKTLKSDPGVPVPPSNIEEQQEEPMIAHVADIETPAGDAQGRTIHAFSMSRFSVGLALAPDLSSASSFTSSPGLGYKAGITFEYQLNQKLSLSTGVVQSMVRYSARGYGYELPTYQTIQPNQISGECLLLDIPVTLKYNFLDFSRSRLFATAGVSSYIMLNEVYDFSYEYEIEGEELMSSWSGQTGTRHWLSNAALSVGYEQDIHRHMSLRVEPFVRVPLQEVGWTNIRLYSMGSFISINYRL